MYSSKRKPFEASCKKFNSHLEGIESNLQVVGWINTIQFASKAFIYDSTLTDITKLNRAHDMAELSIYLANEVRDSIESHIADLEEWKKARDKPTTEASSR